MDPDLIRGMERAVVRLSSGADPSDSDGAELANQAREAPGTATKPAVDASQRAREALPVGDSAGDLSAADLYEISGPR
jgi:hypothetical protein